MVVVHRGKDAAILLCFWPDLLAATPSVRTDQQRRRCYRRPSRSCLGSDRIKRRSHAGLPRTADRSHIKRPPRAKKATQATASHASGSSRMLAVASQRHVAVQAAIARWPPHRRRRRQRQWGVRVFLKRKL
ncbi:hypothetical protein B296_00003432 [Ensete ventricosum]|uniref:Uncharacterized protein n=1 Tax=Ensete ventricosum TaxID=4639 RepID=A0A427AZ98_ENSVE|nr:hypothetical protein B296_00003432 [Ensete ventricosum]